MGSELTILEKLYAEAMACSRKSEVIAVINKYIMRQQNADDMEIVKMAEEMGGI